MKTNKSIIHTLLSAVAGASIMLVIGAGSQKLTGTVSGLDEEAKIVHEIEKGQAYDFRLHVAYYYAVAELENDDFYTNDPTGTHLQAMDHSIVCELRRSMLCEDAPSWIKEQLPHTRWWSTNTIQGVPWRWQSQHNTNAPYNLLRGPGVDFSKVDERDIP